MSCRQFIKIRFDDGTYISPTTLITQWLKYKGHTQETRYVGSAAGHHLVKVFSSANRQARAGPTIRHFLADRFVRSHGCVLTRPVIRRMRRRVSISFCRRPSLRYSLGSPLHWSLHRRSMTAAVDLSIGKFLIVLSHRLFETWNKFGCANRTSAANQRR